jgi:RNA polymerase sigma-70 factor (ECF subfamily)
MRAATASERDRKLRDLPQRFRRRQPQALADLYDLYADLLYVLVKGIVKKPSVVDSLVQESFLRVWNRADELEEALPAMASELLRIGRQCALDYIQTSSDRRRGLAIATPEFPTVALKRDQSSQYRAAIREGFAILSKNEKRVVHLSFYQGLSRERIAEQLREPIEKIEEWTKAGKTRLMAKLDRYLLDLIVE